jgi:hypothetical protein
VRLYGARPCVEGAPGMVQSVYIGCRQAVQLSSGTG